MLSSFIIAEKIVREVLAGTKFGGTYDMHGNEATHKDGYYVSLEGTEYRQKQELFYEDYVATQFFLYQFIDTQMHTVVGVFSYWGWWLDNGYVYVDTSIRILDEYYAREKAIVNNQLAYYDIARGESIYLEN